MIRYFLEPHEDTVMIIVKDPKKGITYSRTPLTEWYRHIFIFDFLRKEG